MVELLVGGILPLNPLRTGGKPSLDDTSLGRGIERVHGGGKLAVIDPLSSHLVEKVLTEHSQSGSDT